MNRLPPRPVQAFFLVDRSSAGLSYLEQNFKSFIQEFPKIETSIFVMGAAARPVDQSDIYCNLGETLELIYPKIKGTHRVEIFLFLQNEPQGWKNGIEKLRKNPFVRVTIFDFSSSSNLQDKLNGISIGWGNDNIIFKLTGTKNIKKEKLFDVIRACLKDDARKLRPHDFQSPNSNQVQELTTEPAKKDPVIATDNMFNFEGASAARRLPVYLLLDTSGSMAGAPIEAVNQGIALLSNQLKKNPTAIDTAYISVITFDSEAKVVVPLTEIMAFFPPKLQAKRDRSLGEALKLLNDTLDKELILNTPESKGDYKPLVFMMTDGNPTDSWQNAAATLKARTTAKPVIIALACGNGVDESILKDVANVVLKMENVTPDALEVYFQWLSQSVGIASTSAQQGNGEEVQIGLEKPPSVIKLL